MDTIISLKILLIWKTQKIKKVIEIRHENNTDLEPHKKQPIIPKNETIRYLVSFNEEYKYKKKRQNTEETYPKLKDIS